MAADPSLMKLSGMAKNSLTQKTSGVGTMQNQYATTLFAQKNNEYLNQQRLNQTNRLLQG